MATKTKKSGVKRFRQFHAIMTLVKLRADDPCVVWRDHEGVQHLMYKGDFNKLVAKGEWQGPLLCDGLWEEIQRYRYGSQTIRAVFADELPG